MVDPRPRLLTLALLAVLTLAAPARAETPETSIRRLLAKDGPAAGKYGFAVADAATGEVLHRVDAAAPRIPASAMKVVTSGAAMLELGAGFRFRTEARAAARPDGAGVIGGDLVVVGSGDPSLTAAESPGAPDGRIEELVRALARAGVRRVEGDLVLDDGRFDRELRGAGWPADQLDRSYCAPVGALSVEKNCVTVVVHPGAAPGSSARIELRPGTRVLTVKNEMTTTAKKGEQNIVLFIPPGDTTLHAKGKVWIRSEGFPAEIAVPDPTVWFGDLFARALVRAGIAVRGDVVRGAGAGADTEVVLAAIETPLLSVLTEMNRESENLYAECVLKTLGAVRGAEGSFAGGAAVTARLAGVIGAPEGELVQEDGSGLSRGNRVSPRYLVRLLVHLYGTADRLEFIETLSIAGTDGTLERRLPDLGADVRAKTGTIRGVSALAGYLRTQSGRVLAFAFLENDPAMAAARSRRIQDDILRILHEGY